MKTFTEMPYGYRWMTTHEKNQYIEAESHQWGWMNDEYVGVVVPTAESNVAGYVRQWDCMVEFGLDHDHDPVQCERLMADMNPEPFYDDVPYTPYTFYETGI